MLEKNTQLNTNVKADAVETDPENTRGDNIIY